MSTNRYLGQDPILTNQALAYENDNYVAEDFLPSAPVATQSGKHWIYDRGRFRPSKNGGVRAEGARSEEVLHEFTTGLPYFAEDHAKKVFVTDEEDENAKATGRDPFSDATDHVTEIQLVDREVEAASILTTTGNYASGHVEALAGGDQWSDYGNSTPIQDVHAAIQTIHSKLFVDANKILLPKQVFTVLQDHPDFLERAKYTQLGVVTTDLLARIWGVDQVVVAGAGKNTARAGQTDSMGYIWGKNVVISYVNPSQGEKVLTFGRNYQWKSAIVERLRGTDEQDRRGTYVRRGDHYYDQRIVSNEAGFLFTSAVA
ncbi:hypothetical protein [Streptomyces cinereoruber]|uniref:hypothetical protein n=1 Tax=Streptomyces cinereoruber TaxID=67260 RepID=UPI00362500BF